MAAHGRSVVFISHKLREVRKVANRIVVLRRGTVVGEVGPQTSQAQLASRMVGRELMLHPNRPPSPRGEAQLELVDVVVQGQPGLHAVSLTVHAGEIYGVAGVDGNGQLELEELLSGLKPLGGGMVRIAGRVATDLSPRVLRHAGVARELSRGGQVLVAAQPTRGVDVGATEFVYQQLLRMRSLGMAILLISTDLDEVVALSDRIGVLYQGRLVGVTDQPDRERLGLWMAGVTEKDGGA